MPQAGKPSDNRRTHKKSRNGCIICKQRRVKCDERRPRCGKCAVGKRPCKYANDPQATDGSVTASTPSSTTPQLTSLLGDGTISVAPGGTFAAIHMTLLYHAINNMAQFMGINDNVQLIIKIAIEHSQTAPYLLDQLLAISALHMSVMDPESAAAFNHHATELQTRAVCAFNDAQSLPERDTQVDLVFATLLGMHVLRNTLSDHTQSLGVFVGAFVKYIRIHRGVRAIISKNWPSILESELKPLLAFEIWEDVMNSTPGTETAQVRGFLEAQTDLSESALHPTMEALDSIQWILDVSKRSLPGTRLGVQAIFSWPIVIKDAYIDTLYQHRPEALVVLAFFAAIMYQYRDYWVFGDTGRVLFDLIAGHVGPFWEEALEWPRQVISSDTLGFEMVVDGTATEKSPSVPVEPAMYHGTPLS